MHQLPYQASQRGAALLLMLFIVGLAAASLLLYTYRNVDEQLEIQNQQQSLLAAANEALLGYALRNGHLPRPAVSAQNGRESQRSCETSAECTGYLPWLTLGITGTDRWGNVIRYSVTPSYTIDGIDPLVVAGDKRILGRDNKGGLHYLLGDRICKRATLCSPAVLIASGKSGPARSQTGMTRGFNNRVNPDESYNFIAKNNFIFRPATKDEQAIGGEFDDAVNWVSTKLLYQRMSATGTLH